MGIHLLLVALAATLVGACSRPMAAREAAPPPLRTPPSAPLTFSAELSPYPLHPTARTRSVEEIYRRTANPTIDLPPEFVAARKRIIAMYRDFGIDLSLDKRELAALRPRNWSERTPEPLGGSYPLPYSIDAPFYHPIPAAHPRVELPQGYFRSGHLSTVGPQGDGFGIGVVIARPDDPLRTIHLEREKGWAHIGECPEHNPWKERNQKIRIPDGANRLLGGRGEMIPANDHDRAVVWIDSTDHSTVSTWVSIEDCERPTKRTRLGDWSAMWISDRERLPNLGDRGGINASGKADLVALLRPGEATDPRRPIRHALSGPTRRAWKAIVYPASNTDNTVDDLNRGLLGYGMLVQLDPRLDLGKLKLSLPARRILEAIQTYGWYMDDTGVRDFDIKGALSAREFAPYGGVGAVDREVLEVVRNHRMYVIAPLVKR
jgi:hypothetical protein